MIALGAIPFQDGYRFSFSDFTTRGVPTAQQTLWGFRGKKTNVSIWANEVVRADGGEGMCAPQAAVRHACNHGDTRTAERSSETLDKIAHSSLLWSLFMDIIKAKRKNIKHHPSKSLWSQGLRPRMIRHATPPPPPLHNNNISHLHAPLHTVELPQGVPYPLASFSFPLVEQPLVPICMHTSFSRGWRRRQGVYRGIGECFFAIC